MNFSSLCEALERLKNEGRIHPNTPVELAFSYDVGDSGLCDIVHEQEPLVCIALDGALLLSTDTICNALVR